jgi:hypothetical protein
MAFGRTYDPNVPDDAMIPVGAARRTDAGRRTPDARPEKTEDGRKEGGERYATLAEVQAVINSLVDSIKSWFVTKSDHLAVVNNFNRYIAVLQSKIPSEIDIKETARKQIPSCLRDLEQAGRQGNVLMLEPGGADGTGTDKDSAYWGTVKASGGVMPDGTALLPHLRWNVENEDWEIALIIPDGTAEGQCLKWNGSSWQPDDFPPADGSESTPHLVWNGSQWAPGKIETSGLPAGGTQYQVLQRDGSGEAVWDWTRWAVETS